jgi:hypothetical protein
MSDEIVTIDGRQLSTEQAAELEALWSMLGELGNVPANAVVVIPRRWPQMIKWHGYPARRMAVTKPSILLVPLDVDAPDEGV